MKIDLNQVTNDLINYSERIESIQGKQIEILNLQNQNIDKIIEFSGKLMTVAELINENKRLDNERINLQNQAIKIVLKHQINMTFIQKVFEERGLVFTKYFEIINKGLESGNDNLVFMGLSAANNLAVSDPLKSIQDNLNALESNDTLELDF